MAKYVAGDAHRRVDGERALIVEGNGRTVDVGIGLELDTKGAEEGVQVVGELTQDDAQKPGCGSGSGRSSQESSSNSS